MGSEMCIRDSFSSSVTRFSSTSSSSSLDRPSILSSVLPSSSCSLNLSLNLRVSLLGLKTRGLNVDVLGPPWISPCNPARISPTVNFSVVVLASVEVAVDVVVEVTEVTEVTEVAEEGLRKLENLDLLIVWLGLT